MNEIDWDLSFTSYYKCVNKSLYGIIGAISWKFKMLHIVKFLSEFWISNTYQTWFNWECLYTFKEFRVFLSNRYFHFHFLHSFGKYWSEFIIDVDLKKFLLFVSLINHMVSIAVAYAFHNHRPTSNDQWPYQFQLFYHSVCVGMMLVGLHAKCIRPLYLSHFLSPSTYVFCSWNCVRMKKKLKTNKTILWMWAIKWHFIQ